MLADGHRQGEILVTLFATILVNRHMNPAWFLWLGQTKDYSAVRLNLRTCGPSKVYLHLAQKRLRDGNDRATDDR